MNARIDRAASAIIAGTSRRRIALAIMEAYRTWPGCTECLPGCTVKTDRSRPMCPRYAVHFEAVIVERMHLSSRASDQWFKERFRGSMRKARRP